jgi:putative resolvase
MKSNLKLLGSKEACKVLNVHPRTLYLWEKKGKIDTIRSSEKGKRFYNVEKYLNDKGVSCNYENINEVKCANLEDLDKEHRLNICYARVSSINQKDDLERQKTLLMSKYPDYYLIEDIGSGINLTKKGILKIIDLAINNKIEEVVVAYKDRLARFGYELIEHIINKYSNGKITIIHNNVIEPEIEMAKDVLQIMNVFVAKMNGKRRYSNK